MEQSSWKSAENINQQDGLPQCRFVLDAEKSFI